MKIPSLLLSLPLLLPLIASADFSRSSASLHPRYPGSGPFIVEIAGTWPSDCHPGEQLPIVRGFDGQTADIEYEIVVVHVTCNDVDTQFRSLVDMSGALRDMPALNESLTVRVDFQGAVLEQSLELVCPDATSCAGTGTAPTLPERGLYVTPDRASEGLLVARQNGIAVIYPLVYDESGRAEWLFSAGRMLEETYFAQLSRWSGGECFECPPGGATPRMDNIGYLTVLVEDPDRMQVKVFDRAFSPYQKVVYGYPGIPVGSPPGQPLTDLAGRWALSENRGTDPPLGDLSNFLPPAFDLALEFVAASDPGQAGYLVSSITGATLGNLVCKAGTGDGEPVHVCEFIDPTDQAEPLLLFYPLGPATLSIVYGRAVIAIGEPPRGTAVRLD